MTAVQLKIEEAAARNAELLAGLEGIQSAPSQLYQQLRYIEDLDSQIKTSEKSAKDTKWRTGLELMDHKRYSESTFRRLAHKASGRSDRFAEKAAKEEREYFDALQNQKTAEDNLAYVRQLRAEAEIQKDKYEKDAQQHDVLQSELDAMYQYIFAGPTPGLPEEDAKEQAVHAALQVCDQISLKIEGEKHVIFLITQVGNKLGEARRELAEAHNYSSLDMFGVADMYSGMQKRNALERAESSIASVRMLQEQVRNANPHVAELGPMNIESGSIMSDIVFDNVFSDMDMHEKIKQSEKQVDDALKRLHLNRQQAMKLVEAAETEGRQAREKVQQARKDLQSAREDAFRRVANGEQLPQGQDVDTLQGVGSQQQAPPQPQEALPAYSA